jgi:hypothetical protein
MIAAGLVAMFLAVNAEQRSLEDVAEPLTAQDADDYSDDELAANRRAGTRSSLRRYH